MRIDACPWPTQCHETPMQWFWLFGIHRSMSFVLTSVIPRLWFVLWCMDAGSCLAGLTSVKHYAGPR
ncbi:hypothetical protein BDZ85DRAFT_267610 [Elsinoe ampelina]|uniref:Uncharacterized protein n=1 Tax=Elsinoe ampelina TaxID=302913 RepID=A0A6A6G3N8_9PEZI|nr:hypothetical protein BDZ85DRAFT_267610 [Elsinoe ampelina]